jgi:hypothetical protein
MSLRMNGAPKIVGGPPAPFSFMGCMISSMPMKECIINVKLANALNQFLYKAAMHKEAYKELGFTCRYCGKPVKPRMKSKNSKKQAHFAHRDQRDSDNCTGMGAV